MSHEALADWLVQADEVLDTNQKWLIEFKEKVDKYVLKYAEKVNK